MFEYFCNTFIEFMLSNDSNEVSKGQPRDWLSKQPSEALVNLKKGNFCMNIDFWKTERIIREFYKMSENVKERRN